MEYTKLRLPYTGNAEQDTQNLGILLSLIDLSSPSVNLTDDELVHQCMRSGLDNVQAYYPYQLLCYISVGIMPLLSKVSVRNNFILTKHGLYAEEQVLDKLYLLSPLEQSEFIAHQQSSNDGSCTRLYTLLNAMVVLLKDLYTQARTVELRNNKVKEVIVAKPSQARIVELRNTQLTAASSIDLMDNKVKEVIVPKALNSSSIDNKVKEVTAPRAPKYNISTIHLIHKATDWSLVRCIMPAFRRIIQDLIDGINPSDRISRVGEPYAKWLFELNIEEGKTLKQVIESDNKRDFIKAAIKLQHIADTKP